MATNKEQLLQYFRGLDISVLEKLEKYSKLLIIPDEDLLVNATMSQMVSKAHTLADSVFPEWTDRSKSDFGEFLVELFALFSEKDFWYINAFANEGILSKMRSYSNAFSKASSLGYRPVTCKASTATFNVVFRPGSAAQYERGDLVLDVDGIMFTNDDTIAVDKSNVDVMRSVVLHEGTHASEDVVYNGYNILVRKPNIDIESICVVIDNILYTQVGNFGQSNYDSTHFMVLPEEDGSCSIYFGSNGYGIQPAIGKTIHIDYRICNGSDGNISIDKTVVNSSLDERPVASATMMTLASGGTYAETLTSIKEKAPLFFYTKRAAINESIAQDIINSYPFVHKSKVVISGNDVAYRVIPSSGNAELSSEEQTTLHDNFNPYLMLGYNGVYTPNGYRDLMLTANSSASKFIVDAVVLANYSIYELESSIRQVMDDLTNPLVDAEYGGAFRKTDADIIIRSKVPGVQNTTFKVQVGSAETLINDVVLEPTEIFSKINQDNLIVRLNVI